MDVDVCVVLCCYEYDICCMVEKFGMGVYNIVCIFGCCSGALIVIPSRVMFCTAYALITLLLVYAEGKFPCCRSSVE